LRNHRKLIASYTEGVNMFNREVWTIGRVGETYVILQATWEQLPGGAERPIWIRHGNRFFATREVATRFASTQLINWTTDNLVSGIVAIEKPQDFANVGARFAKVSPALEYLVT